MTPWLLLVPLALVLQAPGETLTLDEVAAKNQQAVEAITSVDAQLEMHVGPADTLVEKLRWSRDGDHERVRSDALQYPDPYLRFNDYFVDGKTAHCLRGNNPKSPVKLSDPMDRMGVQGWIKPQTRNIINMRPPVILLIKPGLDCADEKRTLSELVADARADLGDEAATLVGLAHVGARDLYQIHIIHPGYTAEFGDTKVNYRGSTMDVFVDPAANFNVCRIDSRYLDSSQNLVIAFSQEVVSFVDYGDGAFLPSEVRFHGELPNGQKFAHKNRTVVVSALVNKALPADALNFRFPKNLLVSDLRPVIGRRNAYIVGADGEFVRTIHTEEEMDELVKATWLARAKRYTAYCITLATILAVLFLVFFAYATQKRREFIWSRGHDF